MPPKKASSEQYNALIDSITKNTCILYGKGTPIQRKEAWETISGTLNAIGGGVEKNGEGWKKAFTEMKSHIKSKIRAQRPLNTMEEKCAKVTGLYMSCGGMPDVPELGLKKTTAVEVKENLVLGQASGQTEIEDEDLEEVDVYVVNVEEETQTQQPGPQTKDAPKKIEAVKKRPPNRTLLLEEHLHSTSDGLQNIASSIQAVADAINNVALAIREQNKD